MNIPETLIEKAIDPKEIREHLRAPYLDTKGRRIMATNGMIAAYVPVLVTTDDHPGHVPMEAIKAGRKAKHGEHCENAITLNGAAQLVDGRSYPRPDDDGRALNMLPVVDGMMEYGRSEAERRPPDLVINAALLLQLAEALNRIGAKHSPGLQIWLPRCTTPDGETAPDYRAPIYCRPTSGPDLAEGLIMPIGR